MRLCVLFPFLVAATTLAAAPVDYSTEIKPLLARRCIGCHGKALAKHGLRLDVRSAALRGGDSGVASIVPGSSATSLPPAET